MYDTAIDVLLQHAQELESDASNLTDSDESEQMLENAEECKAAAEKLQQIADLT
ncbi:TPA: hypothetical protein RQK91_002729 [Vibrio vulnificus]|nr:hypothetical protein [Vibrio vulnificus]